MLVTASTWMYIRVGKYKENKPYHLQLAPRTLPIWDAHPSMNPKNNPTQIVVHYFIVGYLLHFSRKCVYLEGTAIVFQQISYKSNKNI